MKRSGMLIDTTLCVGCYECETACAQRWGNPDPDDVHELSDQQNTAVKLISDVNVPILCMHCEHPTCASVCPVGALEKKESGAVVYDVTKCIGCRYCLQACPFQIPRYQWKSLNPKVSKCDLCYQRTTEGKLPACVEACPTGSRSYGDRGQLVAEARRRIREKPSEYIHAIYGEKEVGGTSTLYLAAKPFHQIGLKAGMPERPLPELTWNVMSKIPNYVFWSGTLLAGIAWMTNRRKEVAEYEQRLAEEQQRREFDNKRHTDK
jgi:formate dehydrogenase iron-sulfur subunit